MLPVPISAVFQMSEVGVVVLFGVQWVPGLGTGIQMWE